MNKRPHPEPIDDENPEWTAEDFAQAKRLAELPASLQAKLRPRGRPKAVAPKERLTVRVEPQALALWRASGPGWQTRMAKLLADCAPRG